MFRATLHYNKSYFTNERTHARTHVDTHTAYTIQFLSSWHEPGSSSLPIGIICDMACKSAYLLEREEKRRGEKKHMTQLQNMYAVIHMLYNSV